MKTDKKQNLIYFLTLTLVAAFGTFFVAVMGYLNYRTTAIELEERVISRLQKETVSELETAIGFGKSFENYYGMEEVFASFDRQYAGLESFVITASGDLLYTEAADREPDARIAEFLASRAFQKAGKNLADQEAVPVVSEGVKVLFTPIHQDGEVIGFFGSLYTNAVFEAGFSDIRIQIFIASVLLVLAEALGLAVYVFRIRRWMASWGSSQKGPSRGDKYQSAVIMAAGILVLSFTMLIMCRSDYLRRTQDSVRVSLRNLEQKIQQVKDQGVNLREVDGLRDYIEERVSSLDELHLVRITEHISEVKRTDEDSALITFVFDTENESDGYMYLEAEISDQTIEKRMRNLVLILLSSMIILLIFVFEMNPLVQLITGNFFGPAGQKHVRKEHAGFSERQVSLALRFTGFLCSTAEYMCVPYAAMMIRDSQDTLFGLSVGMTAALPLTIEGLTQMIGMLLLPRFVKKYDVKPVLVISTAVMVIANLAAFRAEGAAAVIVLCRALAGLAYAGMKQASNYLITRGYETEQGRSANISQDNAGLLAGATCGAGLGAILSSSIGYSETFLLSAVFFLVYLAVIYFLPPWKQLAGRSLEEENRRPVSVRAVARLLFSREMLFFILVTGIPLNIGVMLCVTLIPAICQANGISSVMLSYCYIANGLAGIYLGPALVTRAKARLGIPASIALAFALTSLGIFVLRIPPVMIMIVISSTLLGFLDGFGTPMTTDSFLSLRVVRETVDESTALIFSVVLSYVLLTVAPMVAELLLLPGKGAFSPMLLGAVLYAAAAVLVFLNGLGRARNR